MGISGTAPTDEERAFLNQHEPGIETGDLDTLLMDQEYRRRRHAVEALNQERLDPDSTEVLH
ncbi:MAG: hypothetical protein HQL50_11560 [Magnetococcales bacterium]|nr:hypothetical protein [Magnetococcales bacterium]